MNIELWGNHSQTQQVTLPGSISELDISITNVTFEDAYTVDGVIHRNGDIVRFNGVVKAPAKVECDCCLVPFECEFGGPFQLVAKRLRRGETPPPITGDENGETDPEDLQFVQFDEDSIDITRYVRDVLVLSIPMKSLCSDTCRGLCQRCGANLNEGECGCSREPVDDRWAPLSGLNGDS